MNIKQNAQAIVKECERRECIIAGIRDLSSDRSASAVCVKMGSNYSSDVWITDRDLPQEDIQVIKDFILKKLKEEINSVTGIELK
jgi:hypothetical protein